MAARTRQLAQMAQQLMQLAGERDVAVGLLRSGGARGVAWHGMAWHPLMCAAERPLLARWLQRLRR